MGFVKSATKKSLLGMLKRVDKLTSRDWARIFEGVVFKDELQNFTSDGSVTAAGVSTTTSNFGGILSSADTDVQKALDTIDDVTHADLPDVGTNTHAQIDTHIGDSTIHFTEGSIDHGSISGLTDDDHTQYALRSEWGQNGFEDEDDVSLAWDDGTLTLTVSPVVTSFSYFLNGVKYTETGSLTETITDTEGLWVFYIDSEGSITSALNPSTSDVASVIVNYAIIAYVYWDATNNDGRLLPEWHGASMSPETHRYLHFTQHAQWVSGMAIEDIDTSGNGNSDSDAQFGIGAGTFDDEDVFWQLSAIAAGDPIEIWYRDGASAWRWTETTISGESFPVIRFGAADRLAWNENNGGTWQQTEVDNNDFVLCHIFATNITADDGTGPKYIAIQGQNEYNTIGLARDGALVEINAIAYGTLPLEEIVPIATVIYQTSDGDTNKVKARTQPTDSGADWVDWLTNEPGEGSASDHGSLAGLGDDDHAQYLLADGTRALTGAWSAGQQITAPGFVATAGNDFTVSNGGAFKDATGGDFLVFSAIGSGVNYVGNASRELVLRSSGTIKADANDIQLQLNKFLEVNSGSVKNLIGLSASGVEVGNASDAMLLKSLNHVVQACDSAAPADADLENESCCFYYDSSGPALKVKHKDSSGTVRTGTVATLS